MNTATMTRDEVRLALAERLSGPLREPCWRADPFSQSLAYCNKERRQSNCCRCAGRGWVAEVTIDKLLEVIRNLPQGQRSPVTFDWEGGNCQVGLFNGFGSGADPLEALCRAVLDSLSVVE